MSYSTVGDLLTGDLHISLKIDKQKFIDDAAEEIDSKIGFLYTLPLPFVSLPKHQQLLLKQINNKLASGRLILTLDIVGEENALHAYGLRLVNEAMGELMLIANGQVDLDAPRLVPADDTYVDKTPAGYNRDAESAVDQFENSFMRGEPSYWTPGEVRQPPARFRP